MRFREVVLFGLSAVAIAGCATVNGPVGSVAGGECRLVSTPQYAVRGRTGYDQAWVNRTTEALVDGCRQPRPKARPASLDAPKAKAVSKAGKKRKTLRQRMFGS